MKPLETQPTPSRNARGTRLRAPLIVGTVLLTAFGFWLLRTPGVPGAAPPEPASAGGNSGPASASEGEDAHRSSAGGEPEAVAGPARQPWAEVLDREGLPRLSVEQAEQVLQKLGRTGSALLAVHRLTGDPAYLEEAATRHGDDPAVQQGMAFLESQSPEGRRRWLELLAQSASNNALPCYLSAAECLRQGDPAGAVSALEEAGRRPRLDSQVPDQIQTMEEVLLGAGYPPAEAKALASVHVQLPFLSSLRDMVRALPQADIAGGAAEPGALTSAARNCLNLSRQLQQDAAGRMLIEQLVGMTMEKTFLQRLAPGEQPAWLNLTPADRQQQLSEARSDLQELAPLISSRLQFTTETEAMSYFDRVKLQGEAAALRWLRDRASADPLPAPAPSP